MREWIPISTSPKGRLAVCAVREFGSRSFDEVTVGGLAAAANVTTGALYHHFGSKLGLYTFVRDDVESRLLDRMKGAVAATSAGTASFSDVRTALLVGFDFAVREGFAHLLGVRTAGAEVDRLGDLLSEWTTPPSPVLGRVLAAAWRAALIAVAEGADQQQARAALAVLDLRLPA